MKPSFKKTKFCFFSFFVFGEIFENFVEAFSEKFEAFTESRSWAIDPPILFQREDSDEDEEEGPFIIGGELKIFDALKGNVDIRSYHDVKSIIDFLTDESFRYSAEIEFTLDGEDIGDISSGVVSELLSDVLLGEWRKQLKLPES
ncbi:hypothetical protein AB4037_33805 [Labrys sp. KB_33_2]|uniref:hypothetical protein n=1 Tax=Labrys sp. KB_33_2 TaxID=3237479 RepID=UPI003F91F517